MIPKAFRKVSLALMATGLLLASFAPAGAVASEATTNAPTKVSQRSATFNGVLATEGHKTNYAFYYGPGAELSSNTPVKTVEGKFAPFAVSVPVGGLEPATQYSVRLAALDFVTKEVNLGKTLTFTTPPYHPAQFGADAYPVTVSGQQKAGQLGTFSGSSFSCSKGSTLSGEVSSGTAALALNVAYSGCSLAGIATEVQMNSCRYVYNVANSGPPYSGALGVACTKAGDYIRLEVSGLCQVDIPAQTTGGKLSYGNVGEGSTAGVAVSGTASPVNYTAGGGFCTLAGLEEGAHSDASIVAGTTLSGLSKEGSVGIAMQSGNVDVFMSGKESGEAGMQPRFDAGTFPVTVSGQQKAGQLGTFSGSSFSCSKGSTLSGEVSSGTAALALNVAYSGCSLAGIATEVQMNSCRYVYNVANSGPPYSGALGVACTKAGDYIRLEVSGLCQVDIPAQTTGGKLSYGNVGEGSTAGLAVSGTASPVNYTAGGGFCTLAGLEEGAHSDASIVGTVSLGGYFAS